MADAKNFDDCSLRGCVDAGADVDGEGVDSNNESYHDLLTQWPVQRVAGIVWPVPINKTGLVLLKLRTRTVDCSWNVVCR